MTIHPTELFTQDHKVASPKPSRLRRAFVGGGLTDIGRLRRYLPSVLLGASLIWLPIIGYLKTAPLSYKSHASLILPGSGASASLNLNGIGQASSYANSAFASNAVSPTETYKRLLNADRILQQAAASLNISRSELGRPRVNLVDQTSLIHIEMTGSTPSEAKQRGEAILNSFFKELTSLRNNEVSTREDSGLQAIADYRDSVGKTQNKIAKLREESGLLSVQQYEVLVDRQLNLETSIRENSAKLSRMTASVQELSQQLGLSPKLAAATLKLFADESYLAMIKESSKHETTLAEMTSQYGAQHPKVIEARKARDNASNSAILIAKQVTGLEEETLVSLDLAPEGARADLLAQLVRMESDRVGDENHLSALQRQYDQDESRIASLAIAATNLQELERDFSVAEAVFASAIAKSQSSKSDIYASYPLVQVLENPSLAEKPSSPNRKIAFAAAIAATFLFLFGLFLGWIRSALIGRLLSKSEFSHART